MAHKHWTLDDIPWHRVDPSLVNPDHLKLAKAAAMVEYNAAAYVGYLEGVFADDPEFLEAIRQWGVEETQHGSALARWTILVDPGFDFETRFAAFRAAVPIDTAAQASIRGSRAGEMVARCMVEVGTSSYYAALADATEEPVFEIICRRIAADELRHYKLFYDHLRRYLQRERLGRMRRLWVALGRITETENDELAFAFHAANNMGEAYDRKRAHREYMRRAYAYYGSSHIERAVAMIFKAIGLKPHTWLFAATSRTTQWLLAVRRRRMARLATA